MVIAKSPRPPEDAVSGIITILNWTMAPDGRKYIFFWAERWQVITDNEIPVSGFRSSERWQLIAIDEKGNVLAVFPGCQVKAWMHCLRPDINQLDCFFFTNTPQ